MRKTDNKIPNSKDINNLTGVNLAANEGKYPKTMKINNNNSSVNSFYSSLSCADLGKILNEKGYDDDNKRYIKIIKVIFLDVEILYILIIGIQKLSSLYISNLD